MVLSIVIGILALVGMSTLGIENRLILGVFYIVCIVSIGDAMIFEDKQKAKIKELERKVRELEQTK